MMSIISISSGFRHQPIRNENEVRFFFSEAQVVYLIIHRVSIILLLVQDLYSVHGIERNLPFGFQIFEQITILNRY